MQVELLESLFASRIDMLYRAHLAKPKREPKQAVEQHVLPLIGLGHGEIRQVPPSLPTYGGYGVQSENKVHMLGGAYRVAEARQQHVELEKVQIGNPAYEHLDQSRDGLQALMKNPSQHPHLHVGGV